MQFSIEDFNKFAETHAIYETIEWAKTQKGNCPKAPIKPKTQNITSSRQAHELAIAFANWENEMAVYNKENQNWLDNKYKIESVLEDCIKEHAGLNDIPESSRDKVWNYAWAQGHSDGYYQVYLYLCQVVDLF
jgi:hypothetical protein